MRYNNLLEQNSHYTIITKSQIKDPFEQQLSSTACRNLCTTKSFVGIQTCVKLCIVFIWSLFTTKSFYRHANTCKSCVHVFICKSGDIRQISVIPIRKPPKYYCRLHCKLYNVQYNKQCKVHGKVNNNCPLFHLRELQKWLSNAY